MSHEMVTAGTKAIFLLLFLFGKKNPELKVLDEVKHTSPTIFALFLLLNAGPRSAIGRAPDS